MSRKIGVDNKMSGITRNSPSQEEGLPTGMLEVENMKSQLQESSSRSAAGPHRLGIEKKDREAVAVTATATLRSEEPWLLELWGHKIPIKTTNDMPHTSRLSLAVYDYTKSSAPEDGAVMVTSAHDCQTCAELSQS